MAEESSTKNGILEVKIDSNKSYKDLEEEIAAVASAVGGAKTVGGRAILKVDSEPKSDAKPVKQKTTVTDLPSNTPKIKQASSGLVENSSQTSDESTETKEKDVVLSRHGKDLKPINNIKLHKEAIKPEINQSEAKILFKPKDETVDMEPTKPKSNAVAVKQITPIKLEPVPKKPIKTAKPYPVIQEIIRKPKTSKKYTKKVTPLLTDELSKGEPDKNEMLAEEKYENQPELTDKPQIKPQSEPASAKLISKKPVKHTPHVARLYDTITYHIPLSVDHHNRKSAMPLSAQIVIVVFAIIVVGLAVLWSGTTQL